MSRAHSDHALIEEYGRVVSSHDGVVQVDVQRQSACHSCSVRHGCGSAQLSRLSRKPPLSFSLDTAQHLQPGDRVRLELKAADLARASLLAYGVPLVLALAGVAIGQLWLGSDVWAGLGFVAGLGVGGLWLRGHYLNHASRYLPRVSGTACHAENITWVAEPFDPHRV